MGRNRAPITEQDAHRLLALAGSVATADGKECDAAVACLNETLQSHGYDLVQVFRRGLMFMIDAPDDDGTKYPIFGLGKIECPVDTRLWKSAAKNLAKDASLAEADRAFAAWCATKRALTADQLGQLYAIHHELAVQRATRWAPPGASGKRDAPQGTPRLATIK